MENRVKIHVYRTEVTAKELEAKSRLLGEIAFWTATLSSLQMGKGLPKDWDDQGSIFSQMGELRWQRVGEKYRVLIFADKPLDGMEPLGGDWDAEEKNIYLQDLTEPRVRPLFQKYPHGEVSGSMRAKVCYRNGVIVSISPREILSTEGLNEV